MDRFTALLQSRANALPVSAWLLGSFLVYVLGANLLWLLRSRSFLRRPYASWLGQAARFLYFLGLPYLVLGGWPRPPFSGLLTPEDLGFAGFGPLWPAARWLSSMGTGLALGLGALLFLLVARRAAERAAGGARLDVPARSWGARFSDLLYYEVHWAFYRAGLAAILGNLYAGVFAALALVYLEWALDPFWRRAWQKPCAAGERWLDGALALVVALIFWLTRNLWVCLAVHALALGLFRPRTAESGERMADSGWREPETHQR